MNLRKNKGFTGIDISIAIIIIVIFASVITTLLYNFEIQSKKVERKNQATSIIVDILEYAKGSNFNDITSENLENYENEKYNDLKVYTITIKCENETDALDIVSENNTDIMHVAKKVTVSIKYLVGKEEQSVETYTWILND